MDYIREDSERLNKLGLEFLTIMEKTRKGVEINDRTSRQVIIVNEIIEKMQPGIESIAKGLLNGKSFNFLPGQKFGLDINLCNKIQLGYKDLVSVGSICAIEGFYHYNPLRAGVPTFVMYNAKQGMFSYALKNNPPGHKSGINTWGGIALRNKRGDKNVPINISFDSIINPDDEEFFSRGLEAQYLTQPSRQYETVALTEIINIINEHLVGLNPREERIIRLYFGIGVEKSYTLEKIGLELGISRERVRQIKIKVLEKMRESLPSVDLRIFI